MTGKPELAKTIEDDYRSAPISETDRIMLDYVDKLTRQPWSIDEEDVTQLRAAEFDDRAILDICQVTAYYAFVNRLADGLGVELEDFWGHREE